MPRVICDQVGVCEWRDFATEEDPDTIYADETSEFLEASFTELGMELAKRHPSCRVLSHVFGSRGLLAGISLAPSCMKATRTGSFDLGRNQLGAKLGIIDLVWTVQQGFGC